jgi:hypothetical protein
MSPPVPILLIVKGLERVREGVRDPLNTCIYTCAHVLTIVALCDFGTHVRSSHEAGSARRAECSTGSNTSMRLMHRMRRSKRATSTGSKRPNAPVSPFCSTHRAQHAWPLCAHESRSVLQLPPPAMPLAPPLPLPTPWRTPTSRGHKKRQEGAKPLPALPFLGGPRTPR